MKDEGGRVKERQDADSACCQETNRPEANTKSMQRSVRKGAQRKTERLTLENQSLCIAALAIFFILGWAGSSGSRSGRFSQWISFVLQFNCCEADWCYVSNTSIGGSRFARIVAVERREEQQVGALD